MILRGLVAGDWNQVSAIYAEGIATGNATFEVDVPNWEQWDDAHLSSCRIVCDDQGKLAGWAALSPVSSRCVYGGVAEVSVYVASAYSGRGLGTKLLTDLIHKSEESGIWTLQSGIFPENIGSLKIHQKLGFRKIGHREKVGKMKGIWRDIILLERRSTIAGIG